jgi:hypothetical protein
VRLRLPAVLARGGDAQREKTWRVTSANALGGENAEADVIQQNHEPVLMTGEPQRWSWLPGWAFAAVTQAPALVAIAWLVPGIAMLLAGRLLPEPMVIIFVPLVVALCYFAMRRLPAGWPRFGDARGVSVVALLLMVAIAAGFAAWQAIFRAEPLFAASDPSVYLQYGYWIAGHGTARIPTSAALFGGSSGLDFATTGFTVSGGSLTPSFLPGLPLVLAGGAWLGGLGGVLLMPAVLGGCAVLSFGGLVGRLCGIWWAVAAELVLALCLPEVYVARTPMSEPLVQVLLFGGLCLCIDSLVPSRASAGRGLALAGFGGVALGLTVLASIGSLGMLLPAFPVVAVLFVARRTQAAPFGFGLFAGIGVGLAAGLMLARPYLSSLSPQLHLIGLSVAGFGVVTALLAPLALPGARPRARRALAYQLSFKWFKGQRLVLPSPGFVLTAGALALPALLLAGLVARPYLQTVRGQANPSMVRVVASLQHLEGLPDDGARLYYESSLYWVFWYLGVPAVLLACAGATVLARRLVRRMLSADTSASVAAALRLWVLPFLLIGWSVPAVLWDPSVVPWQPLGAHRLVPVVLPGLLLLAVWLSSRLTSWASALGATRPITVLVGACCVLALGLPPLVTTLNPGLAAKPSVGRYSSGVSKLVSRVRLRGVGASATYGGSVATASSLCTAIGSSASVLFVDPATAASFAPVVRGLCGQPAALVVRSSAAALAQAVHSVEQIGRRPVVLGSTQSSVAMPGATPRQVISLQTRGDAEVLTGPPAGNWPVTYTLWLAVPAASSASSD